MERADVVTLTQAFVSELPSDFLCPEGETPAENGGGGGGACSTRQQQEEQDRQAALALQRYYSTRQHAPVLQTAIGRLNLTIAQVRLLLCEALYWHNMME